MDSKTDSKNPPILALFLRLYWMMLGYIPALLVAVNILKRDNKSGIMFLLFFLTILFVIKARFIDIKFYNGSTADGEIATMKTFYCFSAKVLSGAAVVAVVLYLLPKMF
jgi:hypothetical protein